jgi:hypothetical protein
MYGFVRIRSLVRQKNTKSIEIEIVWTLDDDREGKLERENTQRKERKKRLIKELLIWWYPLQRVGGWSLHLCVLFLVTVTSGW